MNIRPRFEINQEVYHRISGDKGIITDWRYYRTMDEVQYLVNSGYGQDYWSTEIELSTEKVIL